VLIYPPNPLGTQIFFNLLSRKKISNPLVFSPAPDAFINESEKLSAFTGQN